MENYNTHLITKIILILKNYRLPWTTVFPHCDNPEEITPTSEEFFVAEKDLDRLEEILSVLFLIYLLEGEKQTSKAPIH